MQNYVKYQYSLPDENKPYIKMNYLIHPEDDNRVVDINVCHIHGQHVIDCVDWYSPN